MSARKSPVLSVLPGERIRRDVESAILSGAWPPGHPVPSEHALMRAYGCSRMTVNKVLSQLASVGLILRRRRAGSFVAFPGSARAMMEIQDLAAEAGKLGRPYRHEIMHRTVEPAAHQAADTPGLAKGALLLRLLCRHWIDGRPYALESRLISLSVVPRAREESFAENPPGSWLLQTVPWSAAEHVIRACEADAGLARLLEIAPGTACLELRRRTWHLERLVTDVTLTYPGDRASFAGRFSPTGR